ncbi:MAG: c-type cytochrome [Planctomycetaceae bacterium]
MNPTEKRTSFVARFAPAVGVTIIGLAILVVSANATRSDEPQSTKSKKYPPGQLGEVVRLGEEIVSNTSEHSLSAPYVGNSLNCTSCHLDSGRHAKAASFLGSASAYPAWSPREERVLTLEDRVLNCFMRSQNGVRPPNGSRVSVAITTYITWLSEGSEMKMNPDKSLGPNHTPDLNLKGLAASVDRGKALYADRCADCHGADGLGTDEGPPVWGDKSFNDGAGLSRTPKLASWLKVAMPLDDETLTAQKALDIAAFVNSHKRPKFVLSEHLPKSSRLGEYNGKQ